jgi:hypothetical protein
MLIRFWFGCLHFGRPRQTGFHSYDAAVTLCWGWRGDVPASELAWRRIWRLSWDWLPVRIYRSLRPTILLPPSAGELLEYAIVGLDAPWHEIEDKRGIDSALWTGRDKKFIGFGAWHREFVYHCATWRSLMHVYLTGAKERANPSHIMYVSPAHPDNHIPDAECPSEWKNEDGTSKNFTVKFVYGRASVDSNLGAWLVKSGHAKASNIVRAAGGSLLGTLARTIAGR